MTLIKLLNLTIYRLILLSLLSALSSFNTLADNAYETFIKTPNADTAFSYIFAVAKHPRCANCHGIVEDGIHKPTVGEYRDNHPMNITALNNLILTIKDHHFEQVPSAAMNCRSCHQDENQKEPGMPPGAANDKMPGFVWHMPPATMAIPHDITPMQLCEQWLDPAKNSHLVYRGGKDDLATFRAEFLDHHAKVDPLILWSWEPGPGREPAPGSNKDFLNALDIWISAGAPCPTTK